MTPFDLVLVPFPFTDLSSTKQRPCLVLSAIHPAGLPPHYIVAMVTSQIAGLSFPGDTVLSEWKAAGLPKPSLVRLAKLVTVESAVIRKKLGRLEPSDQRKVESNFGRLFAGLFSRIRTRRRS
jgi:mRNA interferase MazF